jgi:hypothetical protein
MAAALSWIMPTPRSLVLRLTLAAGLGMLSDPGTELKVLRVSPGSDAPPTTAVTVTFDRPVAGSLDRSVDPRARCSPSHPRWPARWSGAIR